MASVSKFELELSNIAASYESMGQGHSSSLHMLF